VTIATAAVGAVLRKELREYRRNRLIVGTTIALPVVFFVVPVVSIFRIGETAAASVVRAQVGTTLLLLLLTPVIVPATIAAYSVIGERDQGTLEPVLTTPVRREELILGKALAAVIPSVLSAYLFFAAFVVAVRIAASHAVVDAIWQPAPFLAQALFAPLLATWSIWVSMAISTRSSDVRAAQQLSTLGSLPPLALTSLMSYHVLPSTVVVAVILAAVLVAVDAAGWRVVTALFDTERLITGYGR
jgi:ABC-2 type transport system permease protein